MVATSAPAIATTRAVEAPAARPTSARIGGLDGLRAVAVAAVVAYHLWPDVLPAGFLGVDLFMVLSGYLITGLLVDERARTGGVRLGAFWARRFRRLVPALLAVLTGVALWVRVIGSRALAPTVRDQGLASLLYVGNWNLIADGTSYGALSGPQSPLLHLWSLAIEEQFYVVWPLVAALVIAVSAGRRRTLAVVAAVGALASSALMAVWYEPGHDPLRLYYGTDTRAQSFLIGALAALAARRFTGPAAARVLRALGIPALLLLGAAFAFGDSADLLYRGGFALFAWVAAIAVVAVTKPGSLTQALDRAPLRVAGLVSYGIYLWHWPVIVLVHEGNTPFSGAALLAVRIALIAALTAASWYLIERPYRRLHRKGAVAWAVAGVSVTALSLLSLSSTSTVAYANFDVASAPAPVINAPTVARPLLPAFPHTVLLLGDSGMYDAVPALAAGLNAGGATVVSHAFPGVGLTQPPGIRDNWIDAVAQYDPDLVVLMVGRWDRDFIAAHGDAAYRAEVDTTVRLLTSHGARIMWLSVFPGGQDPVVGLERFYEPLPATYGALVDYVDLSGELALAGPSVRKPDGWHLCPAGAFVVARTVLDELGDADTSWTSGDWRADARYDDPPGGCPD